MHILALVDSPDHVCCRYRVRAFADELGIAGHTLQIRALPNDWWSRWRLSATLGEADIVILQRKLLPSWQLIRLRHASRRLIFDYDDAVFLRDSYSPKAMQSSRRRRRFGFLARMADAVIAGNNWLCEQAIAAGARLSWTIPTCVDPFRYSIAEHRIEGPGVNLVWIGSASTLQGLEAMRPILEGVGATVSGLRFQLICDKFLEFQDLQMTRIPWSGFSEAAQIAMGDIGISWLPDDDWSRGKCGLKLLQYMAAGLPVVANPVGVQSELVRNGENGFLVTTPEEWIEAIQRLTNDVELRRRMGTAGRARVQAEYSVNAGGRLWREALATMMPPQRAAS